MMLFLNLYSKISCFGTNIVLLCTIFSHNHSLYTLFLKNYKYLVPPNQNTRNLIACDYFHMHVQILYSYTFWNPFHFLSEVSKPKHFIIQLHPPIHLSTTKNVYYCSTSTRTHCGYASVFSCSNVHNKQVFYMFNIYLLLFA